MPLDVSSEWKTVLAALKDRLSDSAYSTWFENACRPVSVSEGEVIIAVPHSFAKGWFERKYAAILADTLEALDGTRPSVTVTVDASGFPAVTPPKQATSNNSDTTEQSSPTESGRISSNHPKPYASTETHSEHTFERFVSGCSNAFALAAARQVAEQPGIYNPLLVCGGHGLGKTHLLQAIGHEYQQRHPKAVCMFFTAESFLRAFTCAVADRRLPAFRQSLHTCDLLVIDDVHMLARGNRTGTQEELIHLFDALIPKGRQMLFSSTVPIADIDGLEERLSSRLASGLSVELKSPEPELCKTFVVRRLGERGIQVPEEIATLVIDCVNPSIRSLEGAAGKLSAMAHIGGLKLTPDVVASALGRKRTQRPRVSMIAVVDATASHFGVTADDIRGRKRNRTVRVARQMAMLLCRRITPSSLAEIGEYFDSRRHSTVISTLKSAPRLVDRDGRLSNQAESILLSLGFAADSAELFSRQGELFPKPDISG